MSWHLADITKMPRRQQDDRRVRGGARSNVDILVNNAMVITMTHFLAITEEEWDSQVNVDLKGYDSLQPAGWSPSRWWSRDRAAA